MKDLVGDTRNGGRGERRRILSDLPWTARSVHSHLKTSSVASSHRCFPLEITKRTVAEHWIAAGASSLTFRSGANSWLDECRSEACHDPPNLPASVNPLTLPAPVPIITFFELKQGMDSFSKKIRTLHVVRLIAARV
jgi:hypothetical protein